MTFIDQLTEYLITTYKGTVGELCVVFPNRRAGLFFKASLSRQTGTPIWSPDIFSIEDFIGKISEVEILDPVGQLFELYEVYTMIAGEKVENFDEFSKWGQVLLSDFNEIDSYLVNEKDLFGNLRNIKELENWSLGSGDLTTFQLEYLHFWKSIGQYYQAFTEKLIKKNQAYQGLAYRIAVQNLTEKIKNVSWNKIIFAGFNALNSAEDQIFRKLLHLRKAEVFWDGDSYYFDNKIQEAGRFLRKHRATGLYTPNKENMFSWIGNDLVNSPKKITVTGVSRNLGQAKLAGQLIEELTNLNPSVNLTQTAIVLADENLLFPVLHSLPEKVRNVNVTMGYPLKNTPIAGFSDLIFQLHENEMHFGKNKFYHLDIIKFFNHPYAKLLIDGDNESITQNLIYYLQQNNIVFCKPETFSDIFNTVSENKRELLYSLFNKWENSEIIFDCLYLLIETLKQRFQDQWNRKHDSRGNFTNVELEYLFCYSKIIKRLKSLSAGNSAINNIKTFHNLLNQLVRSENLTLYGEPISGLQVMGMLETRTLDFENIILISANEGILPSGKTQNSFIPYDVKRAFGLPTYSEKDAIFAYHFYRLIQRAKTIEILYNAEPGNMGTGEKSRFLAQLLYEFPKINSASTIKERLLEVNTEGQVSSSDITIVKTNDIIQIIKQKGEDGYSPSLLNIYRNCSLKFYFHLIANLRETEEVEEKIGADTLGNTIHKTLENLYLPYLGEKIKEADLKLMKQLSGEKLKQNFEQYYSATDLSFGKNLLTLKVANKFLNNFFDKEIKTCNANLSLGKWTVVDKLEQEYTNSISIHSQAVKTKGKIDRIDHFDNTVLIIDYKTGKTEDKELNVKEFASLKHKQTLNKSFQLLMYAWLYSKNTNANNVIRSGIISFRQLSAGLKTVKVNDSDIITSKALENFEAILKDILEEIYNPLATFSKTEDEKVCVFCDFKTICDRN